MRHESFWEWTGPSLRFPALNENTDADVCVVGAGIAGMMTAYLLSREGRSVVVIDKGPVGGGQTRNTTAHLTNVIDDRYRSIEKWHGREGAVLAAASHSAAIFQIETIATQEQIECDFERLDGYLFGPPPDSPDLLSEELRAAADAGIQVEPVLRAPLSVFDTGSALRFPRQGQFHPLKFLSGLATAIQRDGGRIYSDTHAEAIEAGSPVRVRTRSGAIITAGAVVVATNTPFNDWVTIHTKQAPYLTYVVGFGVPRGSVTKALYWDALSPYHYARLQELPAASFPNSPVGNPETKQLLIVGGEDHKTGQADDAEERFSRLEAWTKERFPVNGEARFHWSGQVLETVDGLAFIGRNPLDSSNVFIATGDSGMGMTHGAIAGMLLTDLIAGRPNPWASLYDPTRKTLLAAGTYLEENVNVALQFGAWVTGGDVASVDQIEPGSGAVIRSGLTKVAVYRDDQGMIHECSAVCPHLGCLVNWNHDAATWDCPCHGSRFDKYGHMLCGPANRDLAVHTAASVEH